MEIKDLKSVWKKASDQENPSYWVSEADIRDMISNKSNTTIADVARALKFKIRTSTIGVMISLAAVIFGLNANDSPEKTYFFGQLDTPEQFAVAIGLLGLVLLRFSIVLRLRYRQILNYQTTAYSLRDSITNARNAVKDVIRTGTYSDTFGMTVFILWVSYIKLFGSGVFQADTRLLYLLLIGLAVPVVLYLISRRLHYNKYRHFVEALELYLDELNEVDAEKNDSEL